jgi:internalin A
MEKSEKMNNEAIRRIERAFRERSLSLDLSTCFIENEIPVELAKLTWLEELNLSHNPLVPLREGHEYINDAKYKSPLAVLATLPNLKSLILWDSKIKDLAPIGHLQKLKHLDLSGTLVTNLIPICGLLSLRSLDLRNCPVTELSALRTLVNLEILDFSGTQVVDIEPLFELIARGLSIYAENCPLSNPPIEVVSKGRQPILRYLRLIKKGDQPLNESKVILIGDGAAGKSSLLARLSGEGYNPNRSQTHGIQIRKKIWKINGDEILLRIWDFGGQEIMHATHRFFLTRRSIYVIVLDARKDDLQLEYWLEHVRAHGGRSKALVVINKIDENPNFDINEIGLRERYGELISSVHRVSCKTGVGISDVSSTLKLLISEDENTRFPLPLPWRKLKSVIEKSKEDIFTIPVFNSWCFNEGIVEEFDKQTLLRLLNDLGIALHFEELHAFETAVLNPEWLTQAVYRLINSQVGANNYGELRVSDVGVALTERKFGRSLSQTRYPPSRHSFIVEAMAAFELCYRLPELESGEPVFLVPNLLPVEERVDNINMDTSACLELHYPSFLPLSVLPRFIVQMHPWVIREQAWRTGVFLAHSGWAAQALVRLDRQFRRIRIQVKGTRKRQMMEFIRDTFRGLHSTFKDLNVAENVPLDEGRDFVEYEALKGYEEAGISLYLSGKLRRRFVVGDLLNGIEHPDRRKPSSPPVKIFVSYSQKEPAHKANLRTHLSVYTRSGKAVVWDDGRLIPGERWNDEIWRQHREADIVICLMSAAFVDSDYCFDMEFEAAVMSQDAGTKNVVPILVEPFLYTALEPVKDLHIVCADRAVALYKNENRAWEHVMKALAPIIEQWIERKKEGGKR